MILVDIYDMAGWWTLVIALQVVFISTYYYLYAKRKSKKRYQENQCKEKSVEWKPLPLIEHDVVVEEPPLMGRIDDKVLNVGATSFLNLDKEESIMDSALKSLSKYGVGSCGPRGFYGTIDVHLELEERLAKFMEVEETCVYSYGFSTIASAIPSYAKKNDIIFVDEKVWFAIQKGLDAARSTIRYFRHNDADHLEELLSEAAKKKELNPKRRAFLVTEAIFFNTGEMCPLKRMVKLARQYKLRIILDESLTIGVIGKHGRGITEYLDIPRDEIDLIVGSLEHSFATIGGFCAGTHFIVEHQRLSGLGYCFSASLPPMLTQAAISALDIIEEKPEIIDELDEISRKLNKALSQLKYYTFRGNEISPIKHIYLKKEELTDRLKHSYLKNVTQYCLEKGVAMTVAAYLRDVEHDCPEPSIRLASNRKLNDDNIDLICSLLDEAYEKVGPKPDLQPV
ncbi:serine palmitoyltransferase 1 [Pectinophora gossypiella]|uniref:serine palmitoyltransferase 1 n=1 Tax=Pectinophora gossypiella TaxID=13191 RepID=UPI00214F0ED4|nr:serine palmitoyltransferase 1 [Pectinophora gossypiella]